MLWPLVETSMNKNDTNGSTWETGLSMYTLLGPSLRDSIIPGEQWFTVYYIVLRLHCIITIIILKIRKSKICRGAAGRGWGGNVCCGFVVNHTHQWWQGMGSNCSCRFVYMHRVSTCYTTEITNHRSTAKIPLCSLVRDCHTPVSQHHALAWVGY